MVIAALVTFGALLVAWVLAPDGRSTERPVVRGEEAVPVTA
jgi:hypothetical protein